MKTYKIDQKLVKEIVQEWHNDNEQNGEINIERLKEVALDTIEMEIEDLLENEVDWETIEQEILDDDRDTKEEYYERKRDCEEMQGWK